MSGLAERPGEGHLARLAQALVALAALAAGALRGGAALALRLVRSGARACARRWNAPRMLRARRLARAGLRVGALAVLLAALVLAAGAVLVRRVPPGGVGVLQARLLGGGVEELARGPGLVLAPRGLWRLHLLDARAQLVCFAPAAEGGDSALLRVRTKDGNVARVAAAVAYRLRAQEAARVVAEGLRASWSELARGAIERTLLSELAKLSSDELAGTATRLERVEAASQRLREELAPLHVELVSLALLSVAFPAEYEATLQKKQLSRQLARLEHAEVALEEQELAVRRTEMDIEREVRERGAQREQAIAELVAAHEARVGPLRSEASALRTLRAAEAERELARLQAEGDALLEAARLASARRRAELLATRGGALWLAREAARHLRLERVVLDARDPRTPSALRLDELVGALTGTLAGASEP